MAFGTRVQFEPIRSVAFGSITNAFVAVGTATTDHARVVTFYNGTDKDMLISLDGTNAHIVIPTLQWQQIQATTNKVDNDGFFFDVGTIFYIKYVAAPGSGSVYIQVMYAAGGV